MAKPAATSTTDRGFAAPSAAPGGGLLARLLAKKRPLVMGVLNVTPDSFSDGGQFLQPAAAIEHARRLGAEGADIIDIGAESTRPYGGSRPVSLEEERQRLEPILPAVATIGIPVSIDTIKAGVAAWALESGAAIVNDVWGLQRDPGMAGVIAEHGAPIIIMHNRDDSRSGDRHRRRRYRVLFALAGNRLGSGHRPRADRARSRHRLRQDAGAEPHLHRQLHEWRGFNLPLLVGASRKRFINSITPSEPTERLGGSLAAHLLAVDNGAAIIRAHDVAPTVQALAVAAAIRRAR